MNNEYYGAPSTPNENFLAHYGIKGMKWGVRKAIEKGSDKALSRQYRKAYKKLEKLNARTNVEQQAKNAKRYGKLAKIGAGVGLASIGTMAGSQLVSRNALWNAQKLTNKHKALGLELENRDRNIREKYWNNMLDNDFYRNDDAKYHKVMDAFNNEADESWNQYASKSSDLKKEFDKNVNAGKVAHTVRRAAAITGGIGLLSAGAAGSKALAAKRLTTKQGHAKAVADRNAWRNQMMDVFKGTKYENLPSYQSQRKKRRR